MPFVVPLYVYMQLIVVQTFVEIPVPPTISAYVEMFHDQISALTMVSDYAIDRIVFLVNGTELVEQKWLVVCCTVSIQLRFVAPNLSC